MQKPEHLYHASRHTDVEEFMPRQDKIRDIEEGPVVFAAPSRAVASLFLVPTDDSWTAKGLHNDVPYIVISDRLRFEELDSGGVIYTLPVDTFTYDVNKGMGEYEWISKETVRPADKELFSSGLEAMMRFGVQVFIVDEDMFRRVKRAPRHGFDILGELQSENQRCGVNPKSLRRAS